MIRTPPDTSSDDEPLRAALQEKKGKATATRPAHVSHNKPYASDSEPSVDGETGLYKSSLKRARQSSSESERAGSLFSEDEEAPNERASSSAPAVATSHRPSAAEIAAERRRQREAEAKRNKVPAHIARKQNPLVQRLDLFEQPATSNSQGNAGVVANTRAHLAIQAPAARPNTTVATNPPSQRLNAQPTTDNHTSLPNSYTLFTARKGERTIFKAMHGMYEEADAQPPKKRVEERAPNPTIPRTIDSNIRPVFSVDPSIHFIENVPMDIAEALPDPTMTVPTVNEPESADLMDEYMNIPSDPPETAELQVASRDTQTMDVPPSAAPEDDLQLAADELNLCPDSSPPKLL